MRDAEKMEKIRNGQRVVMKANGYSDEDLKRPLIGIVNTYNEVLPGHNHYHQLTQYLREGVHRAGGAVAEFGTISICDGMSAPHTGENYVLPSRDLIADSVEAVARGEALDGLILMASCDKIVPGLLMAAARLDIPCIMQIGGPMLGTIRFNGRKADLTSYPEALGLYQDKKITRDELDGMTEVVCPACGSCQFYGTANSMGCFAEAIGMTNTGAALIPAVYTDRKRDCVATGEAIVELVKKDITARQIITLESLKNGIAVAEGTGASTNLILHTLAIAHEIGLEPDEVLPLFNEYKDKTPLVAHVNPNADYDMEDFYKAGGIPKVMQNLSSVLNLDVMTVSGKTMGENLANYRFKYPANTDVIRTMDEAFEPTGGLVILRGNLAPDSAVAKPSGIEQGNRVFTGPALVFDSEADCMKAIAEDKVKPGNVIVIRYEGPKGGPGAREMGFALKMLRGKGLLSDISVITDGRYSGTNNGCFVGHVSPEAAQGGPIAIVRDGDMITVDVVDKREVHLHLSDEEIAARLAEWKYQPKKLTGQLARYAALVQSCNTGAILDVK